MDALILVDIQNDFMPGGALPVPDGDAVVAAANALIPGFGLVVATQDWHPSDHGSFAVNHEGREVGDVIDLMGEQQILWPSHCVQGTSGASFHSALDVAGIDHVTRKGTDPGIDSYSAFWDNAHRRSTGLEDFLKTHDVGRVVICGLATDYCVKFTALDAVDLGLDVTVLVSGCRAVDIAPGDGDRALDEMRDAGCRLVRTLIA